MTKHKILLLVCSLLLMPIAAADLVLVANPSSGIKRLSKTEVINIYLGRYRRLPSGSIAVPLDLIEDQNIKEAFYRQLVNKNLAELSAYWSRLVFLGKTRPPQQVTNTAKALEIVANNPNALAYINRSAVNADVIIVFDRVGV